MRSLLSLPALLAVLLACDRPAERPLGSVENGGHHEVEIIDGWVRPVAGTDAASLNSAAYFTLANHTDRALALVEVESDAADGHEIHETTLNDGVMRMRPTERVQVPAGESVRFEPAGLHVMLIDLQRDLVAGDTLILTLRFDDGVEHMAPLVIRPAAL